MSSLLTDPILSALVSIVVKASGLLAIAAAAHLLLRRHGSAAARHLVWTVTIGALLLLPILSSVLPSWVIATRQTPLPATIVTAAAAPVEIASIETASPRAVPAADQPVPPSRADEDSTRERPGIYAASVYVAGVFLMLLAAAIQRRSAHRLVGEAAPVTDQAWTTLFAECAAQMGVDRVVRLLRSRERSMPIAVGIRHPAILIPAVADTWSDDRRRAVLLHELAHVARQDCLTQRMAFAACALYWFHPAVWWAARRLQVERELACDDLVIAAGARAQDYAGHLLDIAYSFGPHRASAIAVGMARSPHLERRLLAMVDAARDRRVPARAVRVALTVGVCALLIPLAGATTSVVAANAAGERASVVQASPDSFDARVIDSALRFIRIVAFTLGVSQDRLPGTWEIRQTERDGVVHLRVTEVNSSFGDNVPIERFEGLTSAQLAGVGPIQFRLRRDAGTFTFDGVARNGVAAGTFSFNLNPAFAAEMKKRGFAEPTPLEQYQLARHDIGYAFADELNRQGYTKPSTSDLVRAGQHGVGLTYLNEMGALGYRLGALEPLITLRDHGVTPTYINGLAALGYKGLTAEDARQARDHGVSPEWVQQIRNAGYRDLSMAQSIEARDHGVSAEYAAGLRTLGYTLSLPELIGARDHGVSVEYAQGMHDAGYGSLTMAGLIKARDHGVSLEFVRDIAAQGYSGLPMESLIRIRDHGVTPEYARELREIGYQGLSLDDLVTLRDHGLTAARIRAFNTRAGTRLPVDMLKSLASGGAE